LVVVPALLLFVLIGVFVWAPGIVEKRLNPVLPYAPHQPSEKARALHPRLFIVDLHADSLLWGRDLLARGMRGCVDVPRLREGHVALQGFTVVTKSPRGLNIERNEDRDDDVTLLALIQRWPVGTWSSRKERALYQARRLHETAERSNGKLVLVKAAADLSRYLERRRQEPAITAGFLGIEGAHALDGDLANLDVLFDAGFRMMSPTHFFDNEVGGSAHG